MYKVFGYYDVFQGHYPHISTDNTLFISSQPSYKT